MGPTLDDRSFVTRLDPSGMYDLTVAFPQQCLEALEATDQAPLEIMAPSNVVLTGLGGSAAGGDLTRCLFEHEGRVPFMVNRDYSLPKFVGRETLVFAVSYSGNTEETLAAAEDAKERGAQVVAVTSGGALAKKATENLWPMVKIPGGQPPRTALGYLFLPVVKLCEMVGLLPVHDFGALLDLLRTCAEKWGVEAPTDSNPAKALALDLYGCLPVIYGLGGWQAAVAYRWKGQINENAKAMATSNGFPELCHNEILGWVGASKQGEIAWRTVVLQDGTESAKMNERAQVTARLTSGTTKTHFVQAPGESLLERVLALTYMGDFVSLYLAALNGVDAENIDSINVLKRALAQVS
ncbi:MAG: bifunctional phosphoglucose/phosphomannose isomerase [Fimbriimonadaceae bacterium]|nr:bifunctional phosphoglucose/phosphomannose isomerase [Fimbriimonadaceae bacterium]